MERIDISSLTPERLFKSHISQRKPLIISGVPQDASFKAHERWTDLEYLKKTAGDAPIKVEPMHAAKKQYGTNVDRISTTFGAFLDSLQKDSDTYNYLTTQYDDDVDGDGDDGDAFLDQLAAQAFPEPVRSLVHDVPMRPSIMGNLALQQMNLWVGKSKDGASSGLHHDFHDNLYILLKGRKRFVLFPPETVKYSKPFGTLEKIHKNGLIVYKANGGAMNGDEIRSDGLYESDAARTKVKALESKMELLRENGASEEELEALEEVLDEAIDNAMEFAIQGAQDDDFDDEEEDDDELEHDEELDGLMEKISQHIEASNPTGKKRKAEDHLQASTPKTAKNGDNSKEEMDGFDALEDSAEDDEEDEFEGFDGEDDGENFDEDNEDEEQDPGSKPSKSSTSDAPSEPLSFSQISTQELHQHLGLRESKTKSAALAKAPKPLIVELKAGEMLYLPTSWWHEVTSFSNDAAKVNGKGKGKVTAADGSIHMALNYWFHPPDRLNNYKKPYKDDLVWDFLTEKLATHHTQLES